MRLDPIGDPVLTEADRERLPSTQPGLPADEIDVRRAPGPETAIVAAARAWARAVEAMRGRAAAPGEGAELALYDALAEVDALKTAEVALYQAVVASELISK